MIRKLSNRVWFGDRAGIVEGLGEVKSVINVAHNLRKSYWQNVAKFDWDVWYFRLASPDRTELSDEYMKGLEKVLDAIRIAGKFPLFCHCKMGGHRGPTAAAFAYWHYAGRTPTALQRTLVLMAEMKSDFLREKSGRVYRRCMLDYCRRASECRS